MITMGRQITHAFGWRLDRGRKRENNEDSVGAVKIRQASAHNALSAGIYMVADGVGGMEAGDIASELAVETAMNELMRRLYQDATPDEIEQLLHAAADRAHRTVRASSDDEDKRATTLVIAIVIDSTAYILNVGDSRAYIISDGDIRQVTTDHTMAQALADAGYIPQAEVVNHPRRNILSRAIGMSDAVEADIFVEKLAVGDYLLLCTDGLYTNVPEEDIVRIVTGSGSLELASKRLTNAANDAGGDDNIAVIVVEVQERMV